ncbi:hypothetical protein [Ruania zhangjianzhongii]|uniref:hypothetical protein n=1 Tax=Ruania zhangjianzhongii TaxID=2603206 RepID=UPI0011CA72F3|nr:hypothetical protein [Ruania zhangjianzhongii]
MSRTITRLGAVTMAAGVTAGMVGCGMLGGDDSGPPDEVLQQQIAAAVEAHGSDDVAELTIGTDRRSGWLTLWDGAELVRYDLDDETSEVLSSTEPRGSVPAADLDLSALVGFADGLTCTDTDTAPLIESISTVAGTSYVAAFCGEEADPLKQAVDGEAVPDLEDLLTHEALESVLRETEQVLGEGLTELSVYPELGEVVVHSAPVQFGESEGEVRLSRFLSGEGEMTGLDVPGSSYREPSGDPVFLQADVAAQDLLTVIETGVQEAGADPGTVPFQVSVGPDEDAASVIVWVIVAEGDEPIRLSLDGTVLS